MFFITDQTIDLDTVVASVASPEAGAISTFIGVTRNFTDELQVDFLDYEAYDAMAIQQMEKVGRKIQEKYPIQKIAITHRIGKVSIGEMSVVIAVSASHRKEAIEACHDAIDILKEIVPVWKKEFMTDGSQKWLANRVEKR